MKTTEKPTVRYEDAAEQVTVTGWACKTCHRWYADDEHLARWCCATDLPCDCGQRMGKNYTCCEDCRAKRYAERWASRERREWKGEPLYSEHLERYIFDGDDLVIAQEESEGKDLRLVFCEPQYARLIEDDYWCDELPEDECLDDAAPEISAAVDAANAVILQTWKGNEPLSWTPGNVVAVIPEEQP